MAGANGLPKFELVDREGEVRNPKTQGTIFRNRQVFTIDALGSTTITGSQFVLNDLLFVVGAPAGPYTGPNLQSALNIVGQTFLNQVNVNWTTMIENQTAAAITINMTGPNWGPTNPFPITIPAGTIARFTWELTVIGLVPTARLIQTSFSVPSIPPSVGALVSYMRVDIPIAQTILPLPGAAGQMALNYSGFVTNDPATFVTPLVTASGSMISPTVTGRYLWNIVFRQALGEASTWRMISGNPISTLNSNATAEAFGNADTNATAPIGVQTVVETIALFTNANPFISICNCTSAGTNMTTSIKASAGGVGAVTSAGNITLLRLGPT